MSGMENARGFGAPRLARRTLLFVRVYYQAGAGPKQKCVAFSLRRAPPTRTKSRFESAGWWRQGSCSVFAEERLTGSEEDGFLSAWTRPEQKPNCPPVILCGVSRT